ncbi:hypothetical protein [Gilvimarinus agarilyticus]|uniref:hypothetical protein n=1 Tax=Gilvimarinus agarilyticus TaxID=679259 RepID=UPI0038B84402
MTQSRKDIDFDLNQALEDLKAGKPMNGKDGFLTPLIKQLTEAALKAEQEQHIAGDEQPARTAHLQDRQISLWEL